MKKLIKKNGFSFPLWNIFFSPKEQIFLFFLVFLGLVLRIINALSTPFWRDEIYIFYVARTNTLWQLITQQHWDTAHPPLYSVFLHFWQMVSIHPFWLRVPSILTSFFLLYLIPVLAVKIVKDYKRFPFVLLFLFAISNTQISLNMVARPYPFVSLLSVISLIHLLDLCNLPSLSLKKTLPFILVNALGFCVDYSFVWLFLTYFFVFSIHLILNQKRKIIITLIQALVVVQILLLPVFFSLYSNLSQSLHLESGARMKFAPSPKTNVSIGKQLNIVVSLRGKNPTMLIGNSQDIFLKKQASWTKSLLSDTHYVGFNLPPISGMIVSELNHCSSDQSDRCGHFDDYLHTLRVSHLKSVFSRRIGPYVFLFNFHPTDWKNFTFPISSVQNPLRIMLRTSFIPIGQDPSAEIVFATSTKKNLMYLDPKEVKSIMHIKSRNFHYEASFNEEAHDLEAVIIDGFTFFDKFGNDLLFFAGLPSFSKNNYSYFSIVLIIVSIITLCSFLWKEKTFEYVLMPSLFFIPLLSSYILSILVSPIFVGRNLYVASFSYLVGIALLVALLIDKGGMKKIVLSGFILSIFIYVLFIKFPFLHYVDPPYEIEVLIDRVLDKSQEKKKVIVFDHASQFEVLFHYQLLLNKEKMNDVSIISLSSFETLLKDVNIDLLKKMYYEYYFISFNQNTDQFKKLVRSLECRLKEVKFTYTTLSYCHY